MSGILTAAQIGFLETHHSAVMATIDDDGFPHVVPVGCALVDGRLWSSGRRNRVRTGHLIQRPHATLTVLPIRTPENPGHRPRRPDDHRGDWVTVLGSIEIKDDDPVRDNLWLYQQIMGHLPEDPQRYAAAMAREERLIYVLTPIRSYGPSWRRAELATGTVEAVGAGTETRS